MNGAQRIAAERQRQIEDEGFGPEHDSGNLNGEMAWAAASYAMHAAGHRVFASAFWPWDTQWMKASRDPVRDLEKAGALIAAEIDRLLRNRAQEAGQDG